MIDKMKTTTFKRVTDEQWRQIAIDSTRGLPFDQLKTKTAEGITLEPLYTKEYYENYFQGKQNRLLEMIKEGIDSPHWIIAQQSYQKQSTLFMKELEESIANGNQAIVYDGTRPVTWTEQDLHKLAKLCLSYPVYAFNVQKADDFSKLFTIIPHSKRKNIEGVVTGIPISNEYEYLRTNCADIVSIHLQGADVVTELAVILAMAVQQADRYEGFYDFTQTFVVRVAIDSNFFMEIAKLRALRVLWQTLTRSYGAQGEKIPIIAESSLRSYTKFDPYMNMVRASNETFAAVLGGVDVMTVHPHFLLQKMTPTAIRNARNIQLVIREETFATDVLDPAGGSYYVDILTNELINSAWGLFQEIDHAGGLDAFIASGALDKRLVKQYESTIHSLNTGEKTLIGTNRYADSQDQYMHQIETVYVPGRYSETFEKVRHQFIERSPKTILLRYGSLADYKKRTALAKGFLAVGGINAVESPVFTEGKALTDWLEEQDFDYIILCTSFTYITELISNSRIPLHKWIGVAGDFSEEERMELHGWGIKDIIVEGQHQIAKLQAILKKWEEMKQDEKT